MGESVENGVGVGGGGGGRTQAVSERGLFFVSVVCRTTRKKGVPEQCSNNIVRNFNQRLSFRNIQYLS